MAEKLRPPRGTHDLMPDEMARHRHVIDTAMHVASLFGFREMATPIFEHSEVFMRPLGETSDVVTKETYTFADRGGESMTLRPEGTAAIARALISNGLTQTLPQKFFYHGPMFRYERPQKGRMRQFHQIGVEHFGISTPLADVEVIRIGKRILQNLGVLDKCTLHVNSLGDAASRKDYRAALVNYLQDHKKNLSEDSVSRLEKNPMRILDSKDEGDREIVKNAPQMSEYRNYLSKAYYSRVCDLLDEFEIEFIDNHKLVRGLDYYCHTAFEFITDALGAQGTVLGGGRYDGLVATLGGSDVPGVGWAAGIERLAMLAENSNDTYMLFVLIALFAKHEVEVSKLADEMHDNGIAVEVLSDFGLKKSMNLANRLNASFVGIYGEAEADKSELAIRDMQSGKQRTVAMDEAANEIKNLLKKRKPDES